MATGISMYHLVQMSSCIHVHLFYVSTQISGESVFCIRLGKQLSVCTKSYMLALFSFGIIN